MNTKTSVSTSERSCGISVAVRIRPQPQNDVEKGLPCAIFTDNGEEGIVNIHDLYNHPRGRPTLKSFRYTANKVFTQDVSTQHIFEDFMRGPITVACSSGISTIFAYGQTGSGKTHTMSNIEQLVAEELIGEEFKQERRISIAFIELAGDSAFDLLKDRSQVMLREDDQGVICWRGAIDKQVQDRDEMTDLIAQANSFRKTETTTKNDTSSRSHAICRISIANTVTHTQGYLYLVDLAGSEAARDIATHGADRMRETREINMSLSVLKDCIRGKVEVDRWREAGQAATKPHLPVRRSALTKVLKHVFDEDGAKRCETVVIACLNPSLADVGASKNTLRYAEMICGGQVTTVKKKIWER